MEVWRRIAYTSDPESVVEPPDESADGTTLSRHEALASEFVDPTFRRPGTDWPETRSPLRIEKLVDAIYRTYEEPLRRLTDCVGREAVDSSAYRTTGKWHHLS